MQVVASVFAKQGEQSELEILFPVVEVLRSFDPSNFYFYPQIHTDQEQGGIQCHYVWTSEWANWAQAEEPKWSGATF